MKYEITQAQIDGITKYLLISNCPSKDVQGIVMELKNLKQIVETPTEPIVETPVEPVVAA